jgi:hypothetical protein
MIEFDKNGGLPESQSYTVGWTSTVAEGLEDEGEGGGGGGGGGGGEEVEENTAVLE